MIYVIFVPRNILFPIRWGTQRRNNEIITITKYLPIQINNLTVAESNLSSVKRVKIKLEADKNSSHSVNQLKAV